MHALDSINLRGCDDFCGQSGLAAFSAFSWMRLFQQRMRGNIGASPDYLIILGIMGRMKEGFS